MKKKILVILVTTLSIGLNNANKLENWINPSIEGSIQQDVLNSQTRSAKFFGGTVSNFETNWKKRYSLFCHKNNQLAKWGNNRTLMFYSFYVKLVNDRIGKD